MTITTLFVTWDMVPCWAFKRMQVKGTVMFTSLSTPSSLSVVYMVNNNGPFKFIHLVLKAHFEGCIGIKWN